MDGAATDDPQQASRGTAPAHQFSSSSCFEICPTSALADTINPPEKTI
jgi:hypothetical protein